MMIAWVSTLEKSGTVLYSKGLSQTAMCCGQEINRKQRAARAGFIKFWPRPPNSPLTIIMANRAPMTGSHRGTVGGSVSESSRPETAAERSDTVCLCLIITLYSASAPTLDSVPMIIIIMARKPKMTTE